MNEPQSSSFTPLHDFYDRANLPLRLGALAALLWPLGALITAMFLTPQNAQIIVPIIQLTPLVAVVLMALTAFYPTSFILKHPDAKRGLIWFGKLIAVELAIGVYFSLVPISNDIGLVPLLILSATAVFFFSITHFLKWLNVILCLVIIGITLTFFFGGRDKAKEILRSGADMSAPAAAFPTFAANIVCDDGYEGRVDLRKDPVVNQNGAVILDIVREGCWSKPIILPESFRSGWCWQPDPIGNEKASASWIAFDFLNPDGRTFEIDGPYRWRELYDLPYKPMTLRFQSNATRILLRRGHSDAKGYCVP